MVGKEIYINRIKKTILVFFQSAFRVLDWCGQATGTVLSGARAIILVYTCIVLSRVLVGAVTYDVSKCVEKSGTVEYSRFWNIVFTLSKTFYSFVWHSGFVGHNCLYLCGLNCVFLKITKM